MTKEEALAQALEAFENMSTALGEDDVLGSDIELMLNAITAIEEALAGPDEDAIIIRYHEMTIKRLEKRIEELTAQPEQEPVGFAVMERPWVGLTGQEKAWIASVSLDVHDAVHRTDASLKNKNT